MKGLQLPSSAFDELNAGLYFSQAETHSEVESFNRMARLTYLPSNHGRLMPRPALQHFFASSINKHKKLITSTSSTSTIDDRAPPVSSSSTTSRQHLGHKYQITNDILWHRHFAEVFGTTRLRPLAFAPHIVQNQPLFDAPHLSKSIGTPSSRRVPSAMESGPVTAKGNRSEAATLRT